MNPVDIFDWIVNVAYRVDPAKLVIIPYSYPIPQFAAVPVAVGAANGQQTQILNIQANADFVLTEIKHEQLLIGTQLTATNIPFASALLQVTDTGTNEQFYFSDAILEGVSNNVYKSGRVQSYPRILRARSTQQVRVSNLDTANTLTLNMVFNGYLVRVLD